VEYFASIEHYWSEISKYAVASAITNTIMASAVAGLAFYVFRIHGPEGTDILTVASNVRALQKRYAGKTIFSYLRNYIIAYSLLTGLIAAALISLQFSNSVSIPTAIIYGTLGPFVLRDAARMTMGRTAATSLDKTVDDIKTSTNQDYMKELDSIGHEDESQP
jgi:hypothetical protein